jgi:hypothetical protein
LLTSLACFLICCLAIAVFPPGSASRHSRCLHHHKPGARGQAGRRPSRSRRRSTAMLPWPGKSSAICTGTMISDQKEEPSDAGRAADLERDLKAQLKGGFRNLQPPLSFGGGNRSSCPVSAIRRVANKDCWEQPYPDELRLATVACDLSRTASVDPRREPWLHRASRVPA